MRKHSRTNLFSLLMTAMVVVVASALSAAQAEATLPGQSDPVGPPANYITLRNDNLALECVGCGDNVFLTYQMDPTSDGGFFGNQLTSNELPLRGIRSSVSAAGRILSQDKDELVNVGRNGDSAEVRFAQGGTYELPNLHQHLENAPDQISVAAGDLDKIPDANGTNHDELVVAYADYNNQVNVAVLNYTAPEAVGSPPKYVTQAIAPFKINLNPTARGFKLSEVLAVAIGDFDGDGQNEIALATLDPDIGNRVNLAIFRYVHATLSAIPELKLVTTTSLSNFPDLSSLADPPGSAPLLPTISLAAGDFKGTGRQADLVLALRPYDEDYVYGYLQTISFNANLIPTLKSGATIYTEFDSRDIPQDKLTPARIICLPGLINYDPSKGSNVYRRGIVAVYDSNLETTYGDQGTLLIDTWLVGADDQWTPYGLTSDGSSNFRQVLSNTGVGASYAATLGGFAIGGNLNNPVWSLAVLQMKTFGSGDEFLEEDISVFQNINGQGLQQVANDDQEGFCSDTVCENPNQRRPAIQAYDLQGKSVVLGAPIKLTVPKLINTDFVLQDPPKQTYWDEDKQKLVVISRMPGSSTVPGTAVSMTDKEGETYQGKSTDTSGNSVGGSQAATASASIKTDVFGIFKLNLSSEVTAKSTYNYDTNQASYNSNYSSRLLTETESTVGDDFISGRYQPLTIWRYRVLGQTGQDSAGKTLNLYYDVAFPGPSSDFKAAGLDLDWYQPIQEPGNILSYPAPSDSTYRPPDMGTYEIPCPTGATDCNANGTRTMSGAMIPATEEFLNETSGSLVLNYVNTTGSGKQITYQHKLGTSLDVKVSYSAEVSFLGGQGGGSVAFTSNSDSSSGNTTTSDSTSTSDTAITITRGAISSSQAYAIYPTVYTTRDGTIKVAYAADPLRSAAGKSFWAGLYGALPDPALNLPLRFVLNAGQWVVNELSSRKQMRGFFVLNNVADPVTGEYNIVAQAPLAGTKVRLSAQVYNYSTAQSFKDCSVQFYAIKYDSNSDREVGVRQPIGETTISLPPRGTAPAQIIWDTTGFGPTSGSGNQDYRIYVDLNYKSKINEKYSPEDAMKTYAPVLPVGLDPGQNDEGYGLATVTASSPAASSSNYRSPAVTFSSTPLAVLATGNLSSELVTSNLTVSAGVPVQLRAQVCSTANSRDPVDVVVFDGDPSKGIVIAWKRIYVSSNGKCESTWFNWTPTRGDHNLVATIGPTGAPSIIANNAGLISESSLKRASLQVRVP